VNNVQPCYISKSLDLSSFPLYKTVIFAKRPSIFWEQLHGKGVASFNGDYHTYSINFPF